MVSIFHLYSPDELDEECYGLCKSYVSESRKIRAARFRFRKDAERCILSECLLKYILKRDYAFSDDQIRFNVSEYGKPELENSQDIHFNLSHSGDYVSCAFSPCEVGVDIELEKKITPQIAERYFTKLEFEYIAESPLQENERFFKIWTLKEAYIKAIGKGLHCPLDSFSVVNKSGEIILDTISDELSEKQLYSSQIISSDGAKYQWAACYDNRIPDELDIKHVQLQNLIEFIQGDQ